MTYEEALKKLKDTGNIISMPRMTILKYVLEHKTHHTAESIYETLKKEYPSISIATVYNTLKLFAKIGIVKQLMIDESKVYYDSNIYPHFHLKCTVCGKIYDVSPPICRELEGLKDIEGHIVNDAHVYFYGVCSDCRKNMTTGGEDT